MFGVEDAVVEHVHSEDQTSKALQYPFLMSAEGKNHPRRNHPGIQSHFPKIPILGGAQPDLPSLGKEWEGLVTRASERR